MSLTLLLASLFVCFMVVFAALLPGTSAEAMRLGEVTRALRSADGSSGAPVWRAALNVETLAKPFTPLRRLFSAEPQGELSRRLLLAGFRKPACADIFIGVRLALPGFLVAFFVENNTAMFFFLAIAAGFFGPDFWLSRKITKRREAIRLSLPDALDLLAICMEAGLGLDQGIVRVGQELRLSHPQMSEELLQINFEQRAGVTRSTAWRGLAERVDVESVRSFVAMLIQTDRFGTPISKSLSSFSDALAYATTAASRRASGEDHHQAGAAAGLFHLPFGGSSVGGPCGLDLNEECRTFGAVNAGEYLQGGVAWITSS
ncbi:MAG: type II secretion system F family protein [Acidobacteriales bacterium]|nr:type II secretion system F family protein [Terriglobales bacterium]